MSDGELGFVAVVFAVTGATIIWTLLEDRRDRKRAKEESER